MLIEMRRWVAEAAHLLPSDAQSGSIAAARRATVHYGAKIISSDTNFALALHGGAGVYLGRDYSVAEAHLRELGERGRQRLAAGDSAVDVVEEAVAAMETSGFYVAGRGSAPNTAGYVELDASIMDGASRAAGAVAAIRDVVRPIAVARGVMERTPHVLLVSQGALNFAAAEGFELVSDPASYYTLPVGVKPGEVEARQHGTVGAVAVDSHGKLAAATSTGGTFGKLEGRVGDSPLIGPGTWADDAVAISCTGTGEHIIRAGGAAAIAWRVDAGMPLREAASAMLDEIKRLGGDAGVIAVAADGDIVMQFNSDGMKRAAVSAAVPLFVASF